jgi:hypothetical protein
VPVQRAATRRRCPACLNITGGAMALEIVATVLTVLGILLTIWSLLYAKAQSKRVSNLRRNQNITLWAALARVGRSISDITKITDDDGFLEDGQLSERQKQILPKVHRGLSEQYIRLAEIIVQNDPSLTEEEIIQYNNDKRPGLENEWRKKQFINLIQAGREGKFSNKSLKADAAKSRRAS